MLAMDCTWSRQELAEGLAALARASGIAQVSAEICAADRIEDSTVELAPFFRQQAQALDIRIEPTATRYETLPAMLRDAAPAVIRVKIDGADRFVLLLGSRGAQLKVLGRDLGERRIACAALTDAIAAPVIAWMKTDVDGCIRDAAVSKKRRAKARNAMLAACLRDTDFGSTWLLRTPSTSPMGQSLRRDGIRSRTSLFIASHLGQFVVGLLVWAFVGRLALGSDSSTAWLWPLGLALLTLVPLQLWNTWAAGLISLDFGVRLKQRLLVGALNLPLEHVRAGGIGEHLSRVFESDGFEALVLSGATAGLMAMVQLLAATTIVAFGVGSFLQAGLVVLWITLACGLFRAYVRQRRRWAQMRLALTNSMVERLVGQQTRLAQESQTEWHRSEDT
jgi:hypothetical protein